MPYIVDNFLENIDINNRISLEILYEVFHFSNKSILLFTLFDKSILQYLNLFLDNGNVDSNGSMIRGQSPIRVDVVGIKFS